MSFIKEIRKAKPPFIIKGNFIDPYLEVIVSRILRSRFRIMEVDKENVGQAAAYSGGFFDAEPVCYLVRDYTVKLQPQQLRDLASSSSTVFLISWTRQQPLYEGCGLPEFYAPRLSDNRTGAAIVNDWLEFLGFEQRLELETWKLLCRPDYGVLSTIIKTVLAYDTVTEDIFSDVERCGSPENVSTAEIVHAIVTGSLTDAFKAVEKAWALGLRVDCILEYFTMRMDAYYTGVAAGIPHEEALDAAGITGVMRKHIQGLAAAFPESVIDTVWRTFSMYPDEGKSRDVLLVLSLFGKV